MAYSSAVQRLAGIWMAMEQMAPVALRLSARKLGALPPSARTDLKRHLYERAFRDPLFAERLARELSAVYCQVRGRPDPAEVVELVRRRPEQGLALGLLWGMGEDIDAPDWQAHWTRWLAISQTWRSRLDWYDRFSEGAEAMELAEAMVSEAEEGRHVLEGTLRRVAAACRRRIRELEERIRALEQEHARLAQAGGSRPLEGRTVVVLGDPPHAAGYRDLLRRYGAHCLFADARNPQEARRALRGRPDAVILVTAYAAHATQEVVAKYARPAPVFFANRMGLGEMERVVARELVPRLGLVLRPERCACSA